MSLPFVDEDRGFGAIYPARIGGQQFTSPWIVQGEDGARTSTGGRGLAHPLGALDRDGGQAGDELIELLVYDSG